MKSDLAKILAKISRKVLSGECSNKQLPVVSTLLFSPLLVIIQRVPDILNVLKYELGALSTAFFKGGCLRKADKSLLAKELTSKVSSNTVVHAATLVVDGAKSSGNLVAVMLTYVIYAEKHFGRQASVVFDDYITMSQLNMTNGQ
jgi:hypothetical protein